MRPPAQLDDPFVCRRKRQTVTVRECNESYTRHNARGTKQVAEFFQWMAQEAHE